MTGASVSTLGATVIRGATDGLPENITTTKMVRCFRLKDFYASTSHIWRCRGWGGGGGGGGVDEMLFGDDHDHP